MVKHNNITSNIILCLILFFSPLAMAQNDAFMSGIKTVVIDPGHGGKDPGCHGKKSNEKTVTLAIGLKVGGYIEEKYPDIEVIYTRKTDVFVELNERAKIANTNKADLFICIHANAGPEKAYGVETYVLGLHRTESQRKIAERENSAIQFEEGGGANYEKLSADAIIARQLQLSVFLDHSITFASKLQEQFVKIGRSDRGVRQAGFLVLYKTTMPSVLIETGFLTNPAEENFLANPENQTKMANSIFIAFEEYKAGFEAADQSVNSTLNGIDTSLFGIEEKEIKKDDVIFRVQIETSTAEIDLTSDRFQNMEIWTYQKNELYKYTVGIFRQLAPANALKKELRGKGFDSAFVVAFQGEERINLDIAIKLVEK